MSYFSCAEPNINELTQWVMLIYIRLDRHMKITTSKPGLKYFNENSSIFCESTVLYRLIQHLS